VLLIIALVPLAIAPGLLSAFDITPKIVILLFCESVMLLFCKRLVNGFWKLYESTFGRLYVVCLATLWLSTAVSTVWSSNPMLSLAGSSWRRDGLMAESALLLFALMAVSWFAEDRNRIRVVLRTAVITGAAASLYGIAQYFGWDPLPSSNDYQAGEGIFTIVRPPSTFGHADYFASWLVIIAFFALALLPGEGGLWQISARITLALAALAIVLSGTRSALLGLLTGAIVFVGIARPRPTRAMALTLAASLACLAAFYISPAGAKLRARVHWSLDDVRGGARLLLWRDSLLMAMHRPWLGYGPETFTAQFPPFESVELSRAYPDFYHESPHNMFLDALVSRGIPDALAVLALCGLAFGASRKQPALAGALAGAITCQQFMVFTIPTALYFHLLIAIVIAFAIHRSGRSPLNAMPGTRFLVPSAAVIAIVFLLIATCLLVADRAMAVTEHRAAAGDVLGAGRAYRTARIWDPSPGDEDLRFSRAMTRLAATTPVLATSVAAAQQAIDSGIRATETAEDRQNAWYNFATIAALRNDRAGVEQGLRRAINCAPNWFKPHWALSQLLELTGRHAEARREASLAMELDGGHDPEVIATYRQITGRP